MPRTRTILAAPLLTLALLATAPAARAEADNSAPTIEQLQQDTQALAEKLKNYSASQKDEAMQSIRDTLAKLDERITVMSRNLADNWDQMSDKSRAEAQDKLDQLQAQRAQVEDWYERLKNSSSSAWSAMKKGFSDAYQGLSEAWRNTEKELEQDDGDQQQTLRQKSI